MFATKGKVDAKGRHIGTSVDFKRPYVNGYPAHSKKPDEVYGIIESVSHGPYLEMFARQNWPGWDSWGNQAPNSIDWNY